MTIRAMFLDVYKTLLEVKPPPVAAAERWESLWEDKLADPARLTLAEFSEECEKVVQREHAVATAAGIAFPEVFWPAIAREVLPELTRLTESDQDEFLFQHARMQHSVRLMPGAGDVLKRSAAGGTILAIASNAQPYTLRELDTALETAGLSRSIFRSDLNFWSFQLGFSKPNPHVFRMLNTRVRAIGIKPTETLMVGDRLDNDIKPALAEGWRAWHLTVEPSHDGAQSGTWPQLAQHLGL